MKTYFLITDIHNKYKAMYQGLIDADFDEYNPDHIIVSLGDLFDRGPEAVQVLEFVLDYYKKGRFIGILGNHDQMLINYLKNSYQCLFDLKNNGLNKTINQLAGTYCGLSRLIYDGPQISKLIQTKFPLLEEFLHSLVSDIQFGKFILTHGGCSLDKVTGKWRVDNWANTPLFIKYFDPQGYVFLFGHFGGYLLNKEFNIKSKPGDMFVSDSFIGLDAITNFTHKINVAKIYELEDGYALDLPRDAFPDGYEHGKLEVLLKEFKF